MPSKESGTISLLAESAMIPSRPGDSKAPPFLAALGCRDDLQDHFTRVFNDFLAPTAPLFRSGALSELVATYLKGVLNAALSDSLDVRDFLTQPPGYCALKVVCRTEQTEEPIKLGELTKEQRESLFGKGADAKSIITCPPHEPGFYWHETLFLIPGIGMVWWNPREQAQELTYYSRGTAILLPFERLQEYSQKHMEREDLRFLALSLKGREKGNSGTSNVLESTLAIAAVFGIKSSPGPCAG